MENNPDTKQGFFSILNTLFENAKGYISTSIELLKLDIWEYTTQIISSIVFIMLCGAILFFGVIILEVSLALYIGEQEGHLWVGLAWIGCGNLLIIPVMYLFHKSGLLHSLVKYIIENSIIHEHNSSKKQG
jgi:Putative Actinobacterial Holin-X, holin superfamily III